MKTKNQGRMKYKQSTGEYKKILVARFLARVQTGPVAHTASYTMGTGSFSLG
jgi:hypothetical protein